jgi:predicted phosphodiesterase
VRVAALYDVHGNLPALDAVLAEVEREDVDAIVSGGDLVSGPMPVEVFDRLLSRPDVRFLLGNADRLVVDASPSAQEELHSWCANRLGTDRLESVSAWPVTVELEVDELGHALFCHAIPRDDEPIFTRLTPDETVAELLGPVEADLVVCGHTHVQFDRRLANGPRVVNAGSVGMAYEGRRGAYWALLGPDVELRRTEYDVEAALSRMHETGVPISDEHAGWLLDPPDPEETSAYFERLRQEPK